MKLRKNIPIVITPTFCFPAEVSYCQQQRVSNLIVSRSSCWVLHMNSCFECINFDRSSLGKPHEQCKMLEEVIARDENTMMISHIAVKQKRNSANSVTIFSCVQVQSTFLLHQQALCVQRLNYIHPLRHCLLTGGIDTESKIVACGAFCEASPITRESFLLRLWFSRILRLNIFGLRTTMWSFKSETNINFTQRLFFWQIH